MHEKYKSAFRNVAPSEISVERILTMTKKKKFRFKPLVIAAVILALTVASIISVNAATDGAIVEKVEQVVHNVKVLINGEEKSPDDIKYEYRSEITDNKKIEHYGFEIDDGSYVEFALENNGDGSGVGGVAINQDGEIDEFKATVNDGSGEIELNVPTTSESVE